MDEEQINCTVSNSIPKLSTKVNISVGNNKDIILRFLYSDAPENIHSLIETIILTDIAHAENFVEKLNSVIQDIKGSTN